MLSIAALLAFTSIAQAQDLKVHVDSKGKVGFMDMAGNEVVKCQYESAQPFKNGVAIVYKSGKCGMIDATGKVVLPLKYTQISPWNDKLYLVKSGKKHGLVSATGNIVLDVKYSLITKANCYGKALIAIGGKATVNDKRTYMANAKYGIINQDGNILVQPIHKGLYEFTYEGSNSVLYHEGKRLEYSYHYTTDTLVTDCSYLGYSKYGINIYKAGIIDGTGNTLVATGLYNIVMQPKNGMARYYNLKSKNTECGYHDIQANKGFCAATFSQPSSDITFWTHGDFTGSVAPVNGETWSFIDKTGAVKRSGYSELSHSEACGMWAAKSASCYTVFDESNQDIPSLSGYNGILFPSLETDEKVFVVKKNDLYGAITQSGDTIVPFEYEQALANSHNTIPVKKNNLWGLVSVSNKEIIPNEFIDIILPSEYNTEHYWVKETDSLYYHYDAISHQIKGTGFKVASNFIDGLAHVVPASFTIEDTPVNRAQIYKPGTEHKTIINTIMDDHAKTFGYLVNTNDEIVMDRPVSTLYIQEVRKRLQTAGGTPTETEKKRIMLDVTRENRSYELNSTLNEEEWDY